MIKFFSTGYFDRYILVLVIALVIWVPGLFISAEYIRPAVPSSLNIAILLNEFSGLLWVTAFLLLLLTAFVVNKAAAESGFVSKLSTLIMLFYILLMSVFTDNMINNPIIICNFILILAIISLLNIPNKNNSIPAVFNASFLIGLASLFYSPLIFLVVFVWNVVLIHRVATWRTFVIPLIGISLPYAFLATWYFYTGVLLMMMDSYKEAFSPGFNLIYPEKFVEMLIFGIVALLIIVSVFRVISKLNEKNINLRRNMILITNLIVVLLVIQILFAESLILVTVLAIPASILMGSWLGSIIRQKWWNLLMSILLVLIVINSYIPVFNNLLMSI